MTLPRTLPALAYTDPDIYERERLAVFRPAWIHVGFAHQFERPGDYLADEVAGWPLFVQRGSDGVLRCFLNVCPHRAGPIVWNGAGRQTTLVCRYHGWAFDAAGAVRNARDFGAEDAGEALPDGLGLTSARVATWRNFVFICLDPSTPELADWLGGFAEQCDDQPLETYEFHTRTVRRVGCNWKTYSDNFLEGYHIPITHATTLNREIDGIGHRVVTTGDRRWNLHVARDRRTGKRSTAFMYLWPNFSLNIFANGLAVERWMPRGPQQVDLIFEYFFAPGTANADEIIAASESVGREDAEMSAIVQRNLASGAFDSGLLSPRHENALVDFRDLLAEAMQTGAPLLR